MNTENIILSNNCRFHLGDTPDAWQAWYDDSDWQEITLPHDWSVTLPFDRSCSSGTGYLPGGIGWYRIHIKPQEEWQGKQISICFDGVYKNSRVWCNSYYLGERPNGYISFCYDITDQFRFDADNIISVYVDHREIADSRWYTGSGITRKVSLRIEENVHPVANGIFFTTPHVNNELADCEVTTELINCMDEPCDAIVTNLLFAPDDTLIYEQNSHITLAAHDTGVTRTKGTISQPACWTPESPSLYTLKTYLSYQASTETINALVDTQKAGIRSLRFDADKGFFLNDVPYLFKGVCLHEDAGCFGNAVPATVWHRRLAKLKAMGCNAIRMSHNPHMPELYALCDALGFFVIDEAFDEWEGPKNKWSTGHNVYPPKHQGYYVNFPQWHKKDLVDMIRRDRNHPSIIMWSIGNEIDYPNDPYCHPSFQAMTGNNDANKPAAERMYNPSRPNAERLAVLARELCDIVHKTDTTRPATLAAAFPELSAKLGFIDPLDVVGFNYKEHLYQEHHEAFPDKPFLGSENGHSLSAWKAVTDNDYISGQFLWTGIDYLGEAHGWPIHGSGAGLMTLAGFEKTGYYRRQSMWSAIPMIHLATVSREQSCTTVWGETFQRAIDCEFAPVHECWDYMRGEEVVIKCYTNLSEIELFLNGQSKGIYQKDDDVDCILITLPFAPGELKATGTGVHQNISHALYSAGAACQIQTDIYRIEQNTPKENMTYVSKFTSTLPLYQIAVSLSDFNGNPSYQASTMLQIEVTNGRLIGLENGDLSDVTEYSSNSRRAYHGQLMVYVLADSAQETTITIRGEMLKTKTVILPSVF